MIGIYMYECMNVCVYYFLVTCFNDVFDEVKGFFIFIRDFDLYMVSAFDVYVFIEELH